MNNTHVTVFLISLKAGGVALNLTEASRVYMMDSWWNPSVEYQAMDRIHRLGQKRPVEVIKLVVQDSIESKIVQLQEKKLAMTEVSRFPLDLVDFNGSLTSRLSGCVVYRSRQCSGQTHS